MIDLIFVVLIIRMRIVRAVSNLIHVLLTAENVLSGALRHRCKDIALAFPLLVPILALLIDLVNFLDYVAFILPRCFIRYENDEPLSKTFGEKNNRE